MLNRSPGCAPWVRLYNDRLFAGILHGPALQSHAAQFNMSILSKWWFGEYPSKLAPQVWDALKRAMPAIERAIGAQPPSFAVESEIIRRAYEGNRTLRFSYMRQDLFDPPSYFEMLVRIRQLQMVHIVLNEILPIFLEFFEDDNQKGRGADKELQRMLQNGRGHHTAQPSSSGAHFHRARLEHGAMLPVVSCLEVRFHQQLIKPLQSTQMTFISKPGEQLHEEIDGFTEHGCAFYMCAHACVG